MDSTVDAFVQPWWIHAPLDESQTPRPGQDPRREFAVIAVRIAVAAWMLGMAVGSPFLTVTPTPQGAALVAVTDGPAGTAAEPALDLSDSATSLLRTAIATGR
jgi:hypothetical protein